MTSPHTNIVKGSSFKAKFVKHLPFESATSLADAKHIANDFAENYRYRYRASADLQGNPSIRVGEYVYLDGLAHNMSGYWVVLGIEHEFGSGNAGHLMHVQLGADIVGDTSGGAPASAEVRDFSAELAGQSLLPADSALTTYSTSINNGPVQTAVPKRAATKNVPAAYKSPAPTSYTPNIYQDDIPNLSQIRRTTSWRAK